MHAASIAAVAAAVLATTVAAQSAASSDWKTGRCTYHPYQEDFAKQGAAADNAPGWCGIRYTALDVTRVVAINGVTAGQCAQCLEFRNAAGGPSEFVLIIDEKGAEGLDISRSSFSAAFPGQNPLDPQTCAWRIVDPSNCAGICRGSALECTPGQRNLLPASMLPPLGSSGNSAGSNGGTTNSTGSFKPASTKTSSSLSLRPSATGDAGDGADNGDGSGSAHTTEPPNASAPVEPMYGAGMISAAPSSFDPTLAARIASTAWLIAAAASLL
ncbi:hypothetical protein HK105_208725 [Polyrhizophydium stewartii]|uniref:Expansin-like EG45 domain-containing protein n=1 Tax=Polyrhizophydium stewartii TaxID=2732419 RepID=A0ABR4MWZ4_9FUNG